MQQTLKHEDELNSRSDKPLNTMTENKRAKTTCVRSQMEILSFEEILHGLCFNSSVARRHLLNNTLSSAVHILAYNSFHHKLWDFENYLQLVYEYNNYHLSGNAESDSA